MSYLALKHLHQALVLLSLLGFALRGSARLAGAAWVRSRLVRTAPHIIDTLLLATGLWLAWTLRLTPGAAPWLVAKIIGLIVYIALGVVVMRSQRPALRGAAFVAALLVAGWMVSVAITKSAWGWLPVGG